ncbi:protein javelin isoform X1 [Phlebotomus papatasi]|uniref:protein javelin isoform X1 n=1 Tax=Phlebotomus papatasi TaxID=29031 RepID=UPI0024842B87|nr:protein javelin isoform X1 [Phlebotomus papatasi]
MPRPQILHIVESTKKTKPTVSFNLQPPKVDPPPPPPPEPNPDEIQQEFHDKVDSIRCYWSKLATSSDGEDTLPDSDTRTKDENHNSNEVPQLTSVENIVKTIEGDVGDKKVFNSGKFNGEKSFCPTVEIIELDGKTQTAVVKAKSADNDFDHVRYKVMKSDTFQKNLLTQSRREAQFDGLMQYLQDYSFQFNLQELLANNNVVIIEPVRTKIEKISDKPVKHHRPACRITGGAGKANEKGKNGLKRHFFYHPVRVNKELIDEELPTPDTVRNVRKLFEGTLRMRKDHPNGGHKATPSAAIGAKHTDCLRKKTLRYLAIDTSYDDGSGTIRKWDSASLSSGISSGDLSSPCECTATTDHTDTLFTTDGHKVIHYSSEENLCDDELCDTHYDVLEKIRERGSSVTYYGGRVVDKKSNISPMTKAIMQEIRGTQIKCGACQPHNCPQTEELTAKFQRSDNNYLGVKFKLVKSNSCSSRLELVGTGKLNSNPPKAKLSMDQERLQENGEESSDIAEGEQSVRTIVERLETGAIHQKPVPRIIESKCIEKIGSDDGKIIAPSEATTMTINNQLTEGGKTGDHRLGPVELITQVTVNNHISFCSPSASISSNQHTTQSATPSRETTKTTKVCRNKNVDLAFTMSSSSTQKSHPTPKPTKDKENHAKKASQSLENLVNGRNEQTFRDIKGTPSEFSKAKITYRQQKSHSIDNDSTSQSNGQVVMRRFSDHILYDTNKKDSVDAQNQPQELNSAQPTQSLGNLQQSPTQHKMVKWGTLNKFDEKNYVTNDVKLKQKKKYDEMEFEEFEVLDSNGECYDSLNSCK